MDADGQILKGVIGPYEEGTNLSLTCKAEGGEHLLNAGQSVTKAAFCSVYIFEGDPAPSVKWYRSGELVDEVYTTDARGFVRNDLQLSDLKRSDLLTVLTCQSSNTELVVPSEISVSLDITRECVGSSCEKSLCRILYSCDRSMTNLNILLRRSQ